MDGTQLTPGGVNLLLELLQNLQTGLLAVLHALGLAGDAYGQAAWPFDVRISADMLRFDPGHARRVAASLLSLVCVLVLLGLALLWRRRRRLLLAAAALWLLLTPWPAPQLLFAPAYATSFHRSPAGFTPQSIAAGQRVYAGHCASCHGEDARGEGPLAAILPMWPPTLNGSLLWQRLDGELFWHILSGMRDRHGSQTMPGFAGQLSTADVWAVIDFLQANAAGQSLKRTGAWENPVKAPDFSVSCNGQAPLPLHERQGQRIRLVAVASNSALPQEDPRLVTVALSRDGTGKAECGLAAAVDWNALALVAGLAPAELAGHQFIVDRDGWMRAHIAPGQAWSDDALVCRSGDRRAAPQSAGRAGNLEQLIVRMDAEPVRLLRGGYPH
jgi:mono/diheme cytochrome c family protein